MVSYLLSLGSRIDINVRDDEFGHTPLGMAVLSKNIPSCLSLLEAGADVSIPSYAGKTPLFYAIERLPDVVKDIISIGGIDVNMRTSSSPEDSLPLVLVVIHKQYHLIHTLIDLGANVNQQEEISHRTPLFTSILLNDYYAAKVLLENGADPNQPCELGRTPLYAAIEKGNSDIIRLLVQVTKVVPLKCYAIDFKGLICRVMVLISMLL
jgi:ankyrin repeat protein